MAPVDDESFKRVEQRANRGALCDYALYMGATAQNVQIAASMGARSAGLKMFLDVPFAGVPRLDRMNVGLGWESDGKLHSEGF